MSVNVLELINTAIGGNLLIKIAALVGEDEQKTAIAFRSAVPAILGGLIKKSTTLDGAELVLRSLTGFNGGVLQNFESIISGGELESFSKIGTGISQAIFGPEYDTAIGAVADYSGVKPLASATLLGLATPVVLGVLGHEKETNNLNRDGLASFLNGQKLHLLQTIPQSLMRSLGLGEFFAVKSDTTPFEASQPVSAANVKAPGTTVVETTNATPPIKNTPRKQSNGLLKVLVPLLLIGAIACGWQFMRGSKSTELAQQDDIPATTPISDETVTEPVAGTETVTMEPEIAAEQATQLGSISTAERPDAESQVADTSATELKAPFHDPADATTETKAESLTIETDQQEVLADTEVPASVETEQAPPETISASVDSFDTNSSASAPANLSDVASSTQAAVMEPVAESIPEPDTADWTAQIGFEPSDRESAPANESWQFPEENLDTRHVVSDVPQESLPLIEYGASAQSEGTIESESDQPAIQRGPQVIKGEPYQGGVIETSRRRGVVETYHPQQVFQPRVIKGQPYQGGVIYHAMPNQPNGPHPQFQPYGPSQQPFYPDPRYYQGRFYGPSPYQRPLFDGHIIRGWFPLFN